mmetsp:Transcript_81300/g.211255  ORF Transcript_81300/g.211255 Transcript_81300/m.211255 type:complete len:298 (+) Transcript_81300:217-1110(+)
MMVTMSPALYSCDSVIVNSTGSVAKASFARLRSDIPVRTSSEFTVAPLSPKSTTCALTSAKLQRAFDRGDSGGPSAAAEPKDFPWCGSGGGIRWVSLSSSSTKKARARNKACSHQPAPAANSPRELVRSARATPSMLPPDATARGGAMSLSGAASASLRNCCRRCRRLMEPGQSWWAFARLISSSTSVCAEKSRNRSANGKESPAPTLLPSDMRRSRSARSTAKTAASPSRSRTSQRRRTDFRGMCRVKRQRRESKVSVIVEMPDVCSAAASCGSRSAMSASATRTSRWNGAKVAST